MNESIPVSPAKSAVIYGVLFSVILILEVVISYVVGMNPGANPTYGIVLNLFNLLILPIAFITIACTNYKKLNGGFLTLGESIKIGLVVCLIAALISSAFQSIFYMIFPEYIEEILRQTRSAMIQNSPDMPAEAVEMTLTWTRKFMNPAIMIPVAAATYSILGLIYSLIVGAIVKNDKPQSY